MNEAIKKAKQMLYGSHSRCLNLNRRDIREMIDKYGATPSVKGGDGGLHLRSPTLKNIEDVVLALIAEIESAQEQRDGCSHRWQEDFCGANVAVCSKCHMVRG